jgi:hypothetical protein
MPKIGRGRGLLAPFRGLGRPSNEASLRGERKVLAAITFT